jgi:hypothetical protein
MDKLPETLLNELTDTLNAVVLEVEAARKNWDAEKFQAALEKAQDAIDRTLEALEEGKTREPCPSPVGAPLKPLSRGLQVLG